MERAIDGDELLGIERLLDTDAIRKSKTASWLLDQVLHDIQAMPTLTPPNEWMSVYDRLPEPGERVLATDCGFVGEFYINKRGKWQRYNVNCSELLMALDILYWMPLPAPPDKDNHVPAKAPNEPLTLKQLREMNGQPVWVEDINHWALIDIETGGRWSGIPFVVWAENGAQFCYNIKARNLHCYRCQPKKREEMQNEQAD